MASDEKTERLLNLLITLLVSRTYVTKDRLRSVIEGYRGLDDAAFEKKFERDKDELRALGVPIEIGSHEAYFDDAAGYRVRPDAFALPDIELTAQEAAVVGLAARVWQHAGLASRTTDAMRKLTAAGVSVDRSALDIAQPRLDAAEPSFTDLWDATQRRTPVRFAYRRAGTIEATTRTLQPWGLVASQGRWYAVGHDVDRDDTRVFRLSRIEGAVRRAGPADSYTVPADLDLRALTRSLAPAEPVGEAVVLVRPGAGLGLRARATAAAPATTPTPPGDWDELRVPFAREDALVDEVLSYGTAAVLRSPEPLRARVVARLGAAVGEDA